MAEQKEETNPTIVKYKDPIVYLSIFDGQKQQSLRGATEWP